jgi:hypothetical protein
MIVRKARRFNESQCSSIFVALSNRWESNLRQHGIENHVSNAVSTGEGCFRKILFLLNYLRLFDSGQGTIGFIPITVSS